MTFVKNIIPHIILALASIVMPHEVLAFPTASYTSSSVLASGSWVKVSVAESGMHFLSATELRRMGFSNPSRVRVYGYGAQRLPDRLQLSTYVDDLPLVQSVNTDRGVYFYATGPVGFTQAAGNHLTIEINPFTTLGYYYITESDTDLRPIAAPATTIGGLKRATSYQAPVYHKQNIINPGETGHTLLGEDFISQNSRSYNFRLPDAIQGSKGWIQCSFWGNSTQSSRILLSVNDNALTYSSTDNIAAVNDHYRHAAVATTNKTFDIDSDRAKVTLTFSPQGTVSLARLDYIVVNYERALALKAGKADFHLYSSGGALSEATAGTHLWDVTNPLDITAPATALDGATMTWDPAANGLRHYVAWQEGAVYPAPKYVGTVPHQDLHACPVPDMVIFTHPNWRSEAERVAAIHRNDSIAPLSVLIVEPEELYNEFSSGSPDANSLRYLLKMFWDRSAASTGDADGRLQYLIIMGRSVYDNRRLSPTIAALNYPTLPGWQTDNSEHDNTSYTTDDIYACLQDGAGQNLSSDFHCIAVGRMPVVSLNDARNVVDKLYSYVKSPINKEWKNRALMVADDENGGVFMTDSEAMVETAANTNGGSRILWNKIYIDAYTKQNSTYPGARNDMFRALTEGVVWWNFVGHANPTSWTGDGLMTYTDINNLYLKHYPFVLAATCDFVRWDASAISAAEILYRTESSGIIGAISATRPAYIERNSYFVRNLGKHMVALDSDGNNLTIGEIFRRTKNSLDSNGGVWFDSNKLRYVLLGDPAMRLCIPVNKVHLEAINDMTPNLDLQLTIMACQDVTLQGYVTDNRDNILTDFSGKIYATLYDAEHSTTSHGYGKDGVEVTFEQQGNRLQAVIDSVKNGHFSLNMVIPNEIANNFRPAALNMYALSSDGRDAQSVCREFYVYGIDENATPDDEPPVIDNLYLNHSSFQDNDLVNTTPVVIAEMHDNRSINLSSSGIGHQMLLTVDGRSYTDIPLYYTPYSDGRNGGTLVYQLDELTPGDHSLRLRVWDTAGNSASRTIDFSVSPDIAPKLYDIYADANPASVETNFYITHDRPDALITVNIEVFNMLGRRLWSTSVKGMSDTLRSFPVKWNLCDEAGRRVNRGIYLYRASITTATGETSSTRTRRIAVTAQ
ncbi:MAG: type IX secretion system sortase PorU [Clostridiales bacterium]|nr:type IX secretion system sortase PorU [Clostridiales bacterium]